MQETKVEIWKRKIRNAERRKAERTFNMLKYGYAKPWKSKLYPWQRDVLNNLEIMHSKKLAEAMLEYVKDIKKTK
jgi:hypothetical protein